MKKLFLLPLLLLAGLALPAQTPDLNSLSYALYPEVNEVKPDLPSPFLAQDGQEYVVAITKDGQYAIMPVTLSDEGRIGRQLVVDTDDFPTLVAVGLHDPKTLPKITKITGRTVEEITRLGRPGALSQGGFLAADEDIVSVLQGDDRLVRKLQLTHPQLAKPLFHVLNMMDEDLALNRWNMAKHQWEHIPYFFYHGKEVQVEAQDTKGGQLSIFDDGIEGAFYIRLWREPDERELAFLRKKYGHLSPAEFDALVQALSRFHTGEMQPQYIMRYGFYEGHTFWRADPVAIAFIFGLRSVEEIEKAFSGELYGILTQHFVTPESKL